MGMFRTAHRLLQEINTKLLKSKTLIKNWGGKDVYTGGKTTGDYDAV